MYKPPMPYGYSRCTDVGLHAKKTNRTVQHICCSVPPQQKNLPLASAD